MKRIAAIQNHVFILTAVVTLLLSSCRMDNDSNYTPETRESYFLVKTSTGENSITQRLADGTLVPGWNQQFGVSDADLADFAAEEHSLWMAVRTGRIVRVDLQTQQQDAQVGFGGQNIDHLAVGRDYILLCDSAGMKLGFLKRNFNKYHTISLQEKHPSLVVWHNDRFYLRMNTSEIAIWSEPAATELVSYPLDHPITEIQFDAQYYVQVVTEDTSGRYLSGLDNNSTLLLQDEAPLSSSRERYSPWLRSLYETEYLKNIYMNGGVLDTPGYPDTTTTFEADFFEGNVFLFSNDSLRVRNLNTGTLSPAVAFAGWPVRVWHHIDAGDE